MLINKIIMRINCNFFDHLQSIALLKISSSKLTSSLFTSFFVFSVNLSIVQIWEHIFSQGQNYDHTHVHLKCRRRSSEQAQDWHSERVVILVEISVEGYFNPGFLNPKLFQSKLILKKSWSPSWWILNYNILHA